MLMTNTVMGWGVHWGLLAYHKELLKVFNLTMDL